MMFDFFCKVSEVKNTNTAAAIKKTVYTES